MSSRKRGRGKKEDNDSNGPKKKRQRIQESIPTQLSLCVQLLLILLFV